MNTSDVNLIRASLERLADHAPDFQYRHPSPGLIRSERRSPYRAPLAVATAVVALVGGGYLLGAAVNGGSEPTPGPAGSTGSGKAPTGAIEGEDWSQGPELAAGRVLEADPQFGGAWFDAAGVFHVLLKAGYSETLLKEARAKLDDPSDMVVGDADFSMRDLDAQQDSFEGLVPAMKKAGIEVGMSGMRVQDNVVYAKIYSNLEQARTFVEQRIDTSALVLEAGAGGNAPLETFQQP